MDHPLVNALSFTGSVATGTRVLQAATARRAKVQLEWAAKKPLVVLADADLEQAVDCALQGGYFSRASAATASSRFIVEAGVHDAFVARLASGSPPSGSAMRSETGATEMGPVVDENQLAQNLDYVAIARKEGAEQCLRRRTPGAPHARPLHEPGPFPGRPEHRIAREEIFGPVACVLRADSYEHALLLANDNAFRPVPGICTTSLKHAMHFKRPCQRGHDHGQPADGGRGLPRAVRRPQGLQLRPARAGQPRRRVLQHHRQDGVHGA